MYSRAVWPGFKSCLGFSLALDLDRLMSLYLSFSTYDTGISQLTRAAEGLKEETINRRLSSVPDMCNTPVCFRPFIVNPILLKIKLRLRC